MRNCGYQRIDPNPADDAVAWWYVREFDDGFVYARGGRCRTTREARNLYRTHTRLAAEEHQRFEERPAFILHGDGTIAPVDYGPYGIEHLAKATSLAEASDTVEG